MIRRIYLFWWILFLSIITANMVFGQKVGLVLSGGGAKGIAHIGLLEALEENNIPVDYISGTSIGAIVGSMYAMSYTPKEILNLFYQKIFITGKREK